MWTFDPTSEIGKTKVNRRDELLLLLYHGCHVSDQFLCYLLIGGIEQAIIVRAFDFVHQVHLACENQDRFGLLQQERCPWLIMSVKQKALTR